MIAATLEVDAQHQRADPWDPGYMAGHYYRFEPTPWFIEIVVLHMKIVVTIGAGVAYIGGLLRWQASRSRLLHP